MAWHISEGLNRFHYQDNQLFYLYIPRAVITERQAGRVLVSVHGYTGRKADSKGRTQVKRYAEYWLSLADERGWVILAPHFDEKRFNNNYQRLNLSGRRADVRLNELLDELGTMVPGIRMDKILLFGFSGGGQFVHRYVAFSPERIDRVVCGVPGWYMWPDRTLPYPLGIAPTTLPGDLRPCLRELCRANFLLIVGKNDSTQGAFRQTYKGYDLTSLQGSGRKERAENWIAALQQFATREGCPFTAALKVVPRTGHKINQKLLEYAENYFRQA